MNIHLNINSTTFKILQSKKHFIIKFCNIFKLKYKYFYLQNQKKKIALLRSPHIHKKTWRTYIKTTFKFQYIINLKTKSNIIKFLSLIKILSNNCTIEIKFCNYHLKKIV